MSDTYDPQDLSGVPSRPPPPQQVLFGAGDDEHPEERLTWRAGLAGLGIAAGATILLATLYPSWRAASLPISATLREEAVG